ncbi:Ribosomal RNA small subunit methyltransferase [Bienertia sinuspersici]
MDQKPKSDRTDSRGEQPATRVTRCRRQQSHRKKRSHNKNKTLESIFGQKKVLETLEKNYRALESLGHLKNDFEAIDMFVLADEKDEQRVLNENEDGKVEVEGSDDDSDNDMQENNSDFKAKVIEANGHESSSYGSKKTTQK